VLPERCRGPVQDGGNPTSYVNRALVLTLCFVVLLPAAFGILERIYPRCAMPEGRPKLWLVSLLCASYLLLVPGVSSTLFSFEMALGGIGMDCKLTKDPETKTPGPVTESMLSAMVVLLRTGHFSGGVLIALYAFAIPFVKLLSLLLAERTRFSSPGLSKKCIVTVQFVSKWACPDMFAYILFQYLVRVLTKGRPYVQAVSHLDVGFGCFSVFCVASTISSLWIPLPSAAIGDIPAKQC